MLSPTQWRFPCTLGLLPILFPPLPPLSCGAWLIYFVCFVLDQPLHAISFMMVSPSLSGFLSLHTLSPRELFNPLPELCVLCPTWSAALGLLAQDLAPHTPCFAGELNLTFPSSQQTSWQHFCVSPTMSARICRSRLPFRVQPRKYLQSPSWAFPSVPRGKRKHHHISLRHPILFIF